MLVNIENPKDISELLKYNQGVEPNYGTGTMAGVAWCKCDKCVSNILAINDRILGWFETTCERCGSNINWSKADKYL